MMIVVTYVRILEISITRVSYSIHNTLVNSRLLKGA